MARTTLGFPCDRLVHFFNGFSFAPVSQNSCDLSYAGRLEKWNRLEEDSTVSVFDYKLRTAVPMPAIANDLRQYDLALCRHDRRKFSLRRHGWALSVRQV